MTTKKRYRARAMVPERAVQVLTRRGMQCSTLRIPGEPWMDLYEIRDREGVLRWASRHPDLFQSIASTYA